MIGKGLEVQVGETVFGLTWRSLLWYWGLIFLGTILGEVIYYYVQQILPALPLTYSIAAKKGVASK